MGIRTRRQNNVSSIKKNTAAVMAVTERLGFDSYVDSPEKLAFFATLSPDVYAVGMVDPDGLVSDQYAMSNFDDGDYPLDDPYYEEQLERLEEEERAWHTALEEHEGTFYFTRDDVVKMLAEARQGQFHKLRGKSEDLVDMLTDDQLASLLGDTIAHRSRHEFARHSFGGKIKGVGPKAKRMKFGDDLKWS